VEALPVGNGRLGAMVFGGLDRERIQLDEQSIWAGPPVSENADDLGPVIAEARRLFFNGQPGPGEQLIAQHVMAPRISPRSHQTLGDLHLQFVIPGRADHEPMAIPANYRRSLDLDTAIATTTFTVGGVTHRREIFASAADDVLVVRLTAGRPAALSFDASLDRPADAAISTGPGNRLVMSGQATQEGNHPGVRFDAVLELRTDGGEIAIADANIRVRGATEATLLVAASTDYDFADPHRPRTRDRVEACAERLQAAWSRDTGRLRRNHIDAHRRLFRRMTIDMGAGEHTDEPTDARLRRVIDGSTDPGLEALYVQFGRYLLISSSRPGTMPANLQGLWNEHLAAPWNADYHLNINVQMNYWPAEVTGLAECHEPLFDLMEGMVPDGIDLARKLGCAGVAFGHVSDAWMWSAVQGRPVWGMWPHGAGWLSQHMVEHWRFTRDERFLRERAYPFTRHVARFYLDWLTVDPRTGRLVSGPSTSPENTYLLEGRRLSLSMGPSMDQQIIDEVFRDLLEMIDVLNVADDLEQEVRTALERLAPPVRVGSDPLRQPPAVPDRRELRWHGRRRRDAPAEPCGRASPAPGPAHGVADGIGHRSACPRRLRGGYSLAGRPAGRGRDHLAGGRAADPTIR
jgi:alpha-L-fucosidase 2